MGFVGSAAALRRAIELAKQRGTVRTKDLEAIGIPRQYPPIMCNEGLLIRVGYGVYRAATDAGFSMITPEEEGVSRLSSSTNHPIFTPNDAYSLLCPPLLYACALPAAIHRLLP